MANWLDGYSSEWQVREVNEATWDDGDAIHGIRSISVQRDCTDEVPLLETGSMEIDDPADFGWKWVRIYLVTEQDGVEKHPISTMLFESSSSHTEKGSRTVTVSGRSVLQPAADRILERGSFAAAGEDGAAHAGRLISECTPAPVNVEGSFSLSNDLVFDLGATHLEAAWQLLDAADWCIQIDGDGTVNIRKKPDSPDLELSRTSAGLLMPGLDDEYSIIDIPNRFYVFDDDDSAVAENTNPDSDAGFPKRGRWVEAFEDSPTLVDGESLEAYAQRRLSEESKVTRTYSYTREFWPGVFPYSMVRATLERNGLSGDLRVLRQDIKCGHGITVSEESGMEIQL